MDMYIVILFKLLSIDYVSSTYTSVQIPLSHTQCVTRDVHQLEWEEKLRLKEAKQREAERARQELETRQRIEARVRARLEQADARAREQEKGVC